MGSPSSEVPSTSLVYIPINAVKIEAAFCPQPKANMRLFNRQTGEVLPVRCEKWSCEYCGRIHAFKWCKRIEFAEPKRFLTLTQAGGDLTEAYYHLTRFCRIIRREDYHLQYFAVPELSEQNKLLHFHMLTHGRDWETKKESGFIPQPFISEAAKRAGMGKITDIRYIRGIKRLDLYAMKNVFGYATKKLTGGDLWKDNPRKRRVRYSKEFFPMRVADIDEELKEALEGVGWWQFQIKVGDNWISPRVKGDLLIAKAHASAPREYPNIFAHDEDRQPQTYEEQVEKVLSDFARRSHFDDGSDDSFL